MKIAACKNVKHSSIKLKAVSNSHKVWENHIFWPKEVKIITSGLPWSPILQWSFVCKNCGTKHLLRVFMSGWLISLQVHLLNMCALPLPLIISEIDPQTFKQFYVKCLLRVEWFSAIRTSVICSIKTAFREKTWKRLRFLLGFDMFLFKPPSPSHHLFTVRFQPIILFTCWLGIWHIAPLWYSTHQQNAYCQNSNSISLPI